MTRNWPDPAQIIADGEEAIERLRNNFDDWVKIGLALECGREEAIAARGKPGGHAYNLAFHDWLEQHPKFKVVDAAKRRRATRLVEKVLDDIW